MVEMSINIRFSEPQHYIQYRTSKSTFPLHPNYSTSVKSRGLITTLQVTYLVRAPGEFVRLGSVWNTLGPLNSIW